MKICSIPDCNKIVHARGWCKSHHWAWYANGDPLISKKRHKKSPEERKKLTQEAKKKYKESEKGKISTKKYYTSPKTREKYRLLQKCDSVKDRKSDWRRNTSKGRALTRFTNATRRARIRSAYPTWARKTLKNDIKEIYLNCPDGMVVDHIVPLKACDLNKKHIACGLHVPWNLQYLEPSENFKKSNIYWGENEFR